MLPDIEGESSRYSKFFSSSGFLIFLSWVVALTDIQMDPV
jgi:hypothetical protein